MAIDTGHGATIAFSTNTGYDSFNFTSMSLGSQSISDIEKSTLATTGFREYLPSDLKDTNEVSLGLRFDSADADFNITLGTV